MTRNPRRAYDQHGNEITPQTVGQERASGATAVEASCEAPDCRHHALVSLDGWPDDMFVPDMALRLRCAACGSKNIKIMIDVVDLYRRHQGQFGF